MTSDDDACEPSRAGRWYKSSYSAATCTCVEVRFMPGQVEVRDNKDPRCELAPGSEPIISVSPFDWVRFLTAVRRSRDGLVATPRLTAAATEEGDVALSDGTTTLLFNPAEWTAFRGGVHAGEFDREQLSSY